MKVVEKVKFEDIEENLKQQYKDLMDHPEKYIEDKGTVEEIQKMSGFAKRSGYKVVKAQAKLFIAKQNNEELAKSVEEDLLEDVVKLVNKRALDLMLKHPENEEFCLDPKMIEHIQKMSNEEKEELRVKLADDLHIDIETPLGKIFHFFKELWGKLEPIFSTVLKAVGGWGADMASKAIVKKLGTDNEMSKILSENTKLLITETTETLTETISKTHSGKREDNENEKDEVKIEQTIEHTQEVKITEVENAGDQEIEHTIEHTQEVKITEVENAGEIKEIEHQDN